MIFRSYSLSAFPLLGLWDLLRILQSIILTLFSRFFQQTFHSLWVFQHIPSTLYGASTRYGVFQHNPSTLYGVSQHNPSTLYGALQIILPLVMGFSIIILPRFMGVSNIILPLFYRIFQIVLPLFYRVYQHNPLFYSFPKQNPATDLYSERFEC